MQASSSESPVEPPRQSPPRLPLQVPLSDVDPSEDAASDATSVVGSRVSADEGSAAGSTRRRRKLSSRPTIMIHSAEGEVTLTGKEASFEERMEAWMKKLDSRIDMMTNILHAYVDTRRASSGGSSDKNRLSAGAVNESLATFRANLIKRGREAARLRTGPLTVSREGSNQSLSGFTATSSLPFTASSSIPVLDSEDVASATYNFANAGNGHVNQRNRPNATAERQDGAQQPATPTPSGRGRRKSVVSSVLGRMRRTSVASAKRTSKEDPAERQLSSENFSLADVVPSPVEKQLSSERPSPREGGSPRTAREVGEFGVLRTRSDLGSTGGHSDELASWRPRIAPSRTRSDDTLGTSDMIGSKAKVDDSAATPKAGIPAFSAKSSVASAPASPEKRTSVRDPSAPASPEKRTSARDPPVEADSPAPSKPEGAGAGGRPSWQKGQRSTRSLEMCWSGDLEDDAPRSGAVPAPRKSRSLDRVGEDGGRPRPPGLIAMTSSESSVCEATKSPCQHPEAGASSERKKRKPKRRGFYHPSPGNLDTTKVQKVQDMTRAMSREYDITESQHLRRPQQDPDLERKLKYRMNSLRSASDQINTSMLASLIKHHHFDSAITVIVLLNALLIGAHTQLQATHYNNAPSQQVFLVAEHSCTLIFLVELVARIWVHRGKFLTDLHEKYWNAFDAALVSVSLVDLFITVFVDVDDDSGSVLKVLRVLRVARVMRILRTVRFVSELRVMVQMIIASMLSLSWILVILVALIYVFSIILTTGATDYLTYHFEYRDGARPSQYSHVQLAFGSLFETMYTLYKAMAGGIDWAEVALLLRETGWVYEAILICYTFFTIFAVINIVTGVFVDGAIEFAKRDRTIQIQKKAREMAYHEGNLLTLLQAIDHDGDNLVSASDFKKALQRTEVREFISAMQVEISDARAFFDLLDADNSGEIDIVEFVTGMQRLRGEAKSVDIHMMVHENRKMLSMVTGLIDVLGSTMGGLLVPPQPGQEPTGPTLVQDFDRVDSDASCTVSGTVGQPSPHGQVPLSRGTSSASSEGDEEASGLHLSHSAFESPQGPQALYPVSESPERNKVLSSDDGEAARERQSERQSDPSPISPTWALCWEPASG